MIVIGCEDKNIRVFYVVTSFNQFLKVFSGYIVRVFYVKWFFLREGIFCSGFDDGYVCLNFNFFVL